MIQELNLDIQIHYTEGLVQRVHFNSPSAKGIKWSFYSSCTDLALESLINQWFEDYLQKKLSSIKVPLAFHLLPLFTQHVLHEISKISFGTVSTYGQIAKMLGCPKAARAVGGACGRNPFLLFIPCHRVLDSKQELRGFSAGGITIKESLLKFEQVKFKHPL